MRRLCGGVGRRISRDGVRQRIHWGSQDCVRVARDGRHPRHQRYPKVLPYVLAFGAAWLYAQKPGAADCGCWQPRSCSAVCFATITPLCSVQARLPRCLSRTGTRWQARERSRTLHSPGRPSRPLTSSGCSGEGCGQLCRRQYGHAAGAEGRNAVWSPVPLETDESRPHWVKLSEPQEPIVYSSVATRSFRRGTAPSGDRPWAPTHWGHRKRGGQV